MNLAFTELIQRYDHYFIDLWGVIWDGETVFHESVAFVRELRRADKHVLFLSNSAEFPVEDLIDRLRRAGLPDADESWMATSGQAMDLWFRQNGLSGKPVYVFGGPGVVENVRRAGSTPLELPEDGLSLAESAESDTVVLGGCLNFDWSRMSEVCTAVRAGRLRVILPNPDYIILSNDGRVKMPPGMIAHILERALPGLEVERIGKPWPFIYDFALEKAGATERRNRVLMIGDSLETDIRGAQTAGIHSLLVHHGVHAGDSVESIQGIADELGFHPDYFTTGLSPSARFEILDWKTDSKRRTTNPKITGDPK
jgi:HAD superfamily hydrolase (TIGR01450 family)